MRHGSYAEWTSVRRLSPKGPRGKRRRARERRRPGLAVPQSPGFGRDLRSGHRPAWEFAPIVSQVKSEHDRNEGRDEADRTLGDQAHVGKDRSCEQSGRGGQQQGNCSQSYRTLEPRFKHRSRFGPTLRSLQGVSHDQAHEDEPGREVDGPNYASEHNPSVLTGRAEVDHESHAEYPEEAQVRRASNQSLPRIHA